MKPLFKCGTQVRLMKEGVVDNGHSASKLVNLSIIRSHGGYKVYKPKSWGNINPVTSDWGVPVPVEAPQCERKCSMNTVTACIVKQTKQENGSFKIEYVTQPGILIAKGEADAKLMMTLKYPTKVKAAGNYIATVQPLTWNLQSVEL